MNLRILSDDLLHSSTISVAQRERAETISLLKHLAEVERRHRFSKFKCDSLHGYCVDHLKMSEPQAGRRVSASRLLNELPVIEEKVLEGSMTLSSVCQAHSFFKKEAQAGNTFVLKEKLELISELEGQSLKKIEKILLSKSEQPEVHFRESVKQKTESFAEMTVLLDQETLDDLNRLKEIYSHALPNATSATPTSEWKRSRYIPSAVRHAVWMRDKGRCTFVDVKTGEYCESRRFLECDHAVAFAIGGEHSVEYLRLRCRAHNRRHAIETFGTEKIQIRKPRARSKNVLELESPTF